MREIKFRAWHTVMNNMFSAEEMGQDELTMAVDGRGFVNVSGQSPKLSQYAGLFMIPMQFTGMLDKNGKEIYEGDIITGVNFKGYEIKNPVIWWGSGWYAGYDDPHNGMRISVDSLYSISNIEIIGNIYEKEVK